MIHFREKGGKKEKEEIEKKKKLDFVPLKEFKAWAEA